MIAHVGPCSNGEAATTFGIVTALVFVLFRAWRRKLAARGRVAGLGIPLVVAALVTAGACSGGSGSGGARPITTARLQIVQPTPYPRLALIGGGTRTQRAPEVLGSQAMTELIAELRGQYDVILVDSPPLTAGVDPFILGTVTGSLLVVLRTGHSHREIAGAKLEVLERLPIRLLGAVLNDVPRGAAYGYYAYYSYYLPGYEAVDEGDGRRTSGPQVV